MRISAMSARISAAVAPAAGAAVGAAAAPAVTGVTGVGAVHMGAMCPHCWQRRHCCSARFKGFRAGFSLLASAFSSFSVLAFLYLDSLLFLASCALAHAIGCWRWTRNNLTKSSVSGRG